MSPQIKVKNMHIENKKERIQCKHMCFKLKREKTERVSRVICVGKYGHKQKTLTCNFHKIIQKSDTPHTHYVHSLGALEKAHA